MTEIRVDPVTPSLGAVVAGVDANREVDADVVATIHAALLAFKVVFLPRQGLSLAGQQAFAARFGEPFVDPLTRAVEGHPGMSTVTRVDHFHSDHMHMADPPKYSMLQMNVVPPAGGDTLFADLAASYAALSPAMQAFLEGLTGLYVSRDPSEDIAARYTTFLGRELGAEELAEIRAALQPHEHPIVRVIPETGRRNSWVSERFTRSIKELDRTESDAILRFLFGHQLRPEFVIRWRWRPGDLAFWDHRTTLHAGVADYGTAERHGQRASIAGGRPVAARAGA